MYLQVQEIWFSQKVSNMLRKTEQKKSTESLETERKVISKKFY